MPLRNYGVLKGYVIDRRIGGGNGGYHIHVIAGSESFRIRVCSRSKADSILLYHTSADFSHPVADLLDELPYGFTSLNSIPGGPALDYTRGNLANKEDMVPVAAGLLGAHDKMNSVLDHIILPAMSEEQATIYVFGERWGPEPLMDRRFGFQPGNGIHNVHMNQGSVGQFEYQNGVFQDGGLLVYHEDMNRWQALLLAFESQSWSTDAKTGQPIATSPRTVRIASALVNPTGKDRGKETITLANRTQTSLDLSGWSMADSYKNKYKIDGVVLPPQSTACITLPDDTFQLSNRGGLITLLDQNSCKVDGVSYTHKQASFVGVELIWPEPEAASRNMAAPESIMGQVFISYSRVNSDFAMALSKTLKDQGFKVWIDQWNIPPSADWDESINNGILESQLFLVVLSNASNISDQVKSEIQFAVVKHKPIFPVICEECEIPRILGIKQIVDFRPNREALDDALQELINAMRQAGA